MHQNITYEDFNFFMPIEKGQTASSVLTNGLPIRRFRGVASTTDSDLQREIINVPNIDTSYFLKYGYFNNDHQPGFENKVGEPLSAKVIGNKLWVEGFLYDNHKVADGIWELLQAQENNPHAKRRVGLSVQGKVKKRDGNKILSCWIQDVAVTTAPVNPFTFIEVVKSLSAQEWEPELPSIDRALVAGHATSNQTDGAALRPESLGPKLNKLTYDEKDLEEKRKKKKLTKSEAIELLQMAKGLSRTTAAVIVDAHCRGII